MLRPYLCACVRARGSRRPSGPNRQEGRERRGLGSELALTQGYVRLRVRRFFDAVTCSCSIESREERGVVCGLRRMRDYSSSVTVLSECEHESIACLQYESTSHGLFPAP